MPSPTAMPARTGQRLRASQRAKPVWKTETYTDSQGSETDGFQDDASTLVHSGRSGAIDGHHVRRKRGKRRNGVAAVGAARLFQSIIRKSPSPCHSGSTASIPAPSDVSSASPRKQTWFSTIKKQAELTAPSISLG